MIQSLPRPGDIGFLYDEDTDFFDRLSHDTQISVAGKVADSLNKARDNALLAVMRRSRNASLSDIPLINAAIKEVELALKNAEGRLPVKVDEETNRKNEEAHKAHLAELAAAAAPKKQTKRSIATGQSRDRNPDIPRRLVVIQECGRRCSCCNCSYACIRNNPYNRFTNFRHGIRKNIHKNNFGCLACGKAQALLQECIIDPWRCGSRIGYKINGGGLGIISGS